MLSTDQLLQLKRWNTPTIYNGWEQITRHDPGHDAFNPEETRDFMPQMGPMVGYAVTVVIEPGNPSHRKANPDAGPRWRESVAKAPGPKIVVVQDLDKPKLCGSLWGEVTSTLFRALGCVGTITDGGVRDIDEMTSAGFKAIARRLCVGHAYVTPVRWDCPVEVFGREVRPGQLIHADKHGFLAIPEGEEERLLDAARFMDENECRTVIPASFNSAGSSTDEILRRIGEASNAFREAAARKFKREGEW